MTAHDASDLARLALRTMRRSRQRQGASLDARRSIELVGSRTRHAVDATLTLDPVSAARTWLDAMPALDAVTRDRAQDALDAAQIYVAQIDSTAMSIAHNAEHMERLPEADRMAEVERMTATLARFCTSLRDTLGSIGAHDEHSAAATARLEAASATVAAPGGFAAAAELLSAGR